MKHLATVQESSGAKTKSLVENRTLSESTQTAPSSTGKMLVQVINPGWGSSGYYSEQVLESAGEAKVFAAGTQMYMDHPSYSESQDRPERSVRDLAAVLTEDARWDSSLKALVAEAQVFGPYRELLTEMSDAIGVSIRASAVVEQGEAEGRKGTIVSELVEGVSVDFVTQAGRGGRILSVLESSRPATVVERAIDHGVNEATANDTRDALSVALKNRFQGQETWVYVRDFDEATVWFEVEAPTGSGTFQSPFNLNGASAELVGNPVEVRVRTQYVPVNPAGSNAQESTEDPMPNIEEARLRQLEEDAGRVQTLESERTAALERAQQAEERAKSIERELNESRVRDQARPIATTIVGESETLPSSTRTRLVNESVLSVNTRDDGTFDETAFRAAVENRRTTAETELAEAMQAAGVGSVRNMGGSSSSGTVTESDVDNAVAGAFGRKISKEA